MTAHAILFRCPGCQHGLQAPPASGGASAHCPQCNTALEVPDPHHLAPGEDPIADEASVKLRPDGGVEAEMDMTPMVDVTFLLLIFFMVTATFTLQKSQNFPTPKKDDPSTVTKPLEDLEDDPDTIIVRVDQYNTYRVITPEDEFECPNEQDLLIQLRAARQGGRGGVAPTAMVVMAHVDALHEKVVTALDAGTAVGMEDVKITTVEEDE